MTMAIDLTAMIAVEEKIDTTVDADEDLLALQDVIVVTIPIQTAIMTAIVVAVDMVVIDLTTIVNKTEETGLT